MASFLILLVLSISSASAPIALQVSAQLRTPQTSEVAPVAVEVGRAATAATASEVPVSVGVIREAVGDLQMPSETDAPMRVEFWASEKDVLSPAEIALLARVGQTEPVKTQGVAEFFAVAVAVEDWMSDDEKLTARRFAHLVEVLKAQLENPRVYLWGERERNVVIVGKVKGGFGGLVTLVVET